MSVTTKPALASERVAAAPPVISRSLFIIIGAVAALACGIALYLLLRPAAASRTGVVRVNAILERYQGAQDARQAFQQKAAVWQANVDTLKAELQNMVMDYERERSSLTPTQVRDREEALHAKEREVQEYATAIMQRMEQEQTVLTNGIASQVKTASEEVGREHGYDLILAIQDEGMLLYRSDAVDATPVVLDYLRTHYSSSFKGEK